MPRRLSALALLLTGAAVLPATTSRPNIILILADDLGRETLGCYGGTSYQTPHLDRMANQGVRFSHAYAQPLCTPTRVQLMTGQSNIRNYLNFGRMDPTLTTFAHPFREAGYRTGIAGKWQLGQEKDLPRRLGFEEACLWQHTRRPPRYANPGLEYNGEERDFTHGEYGPDLVHAWAEEFITRDRERPFLLYYPMLLVHDPFQPTPESANWDPQAQGEQVNRSPANFTAMMAHMDTLVGRLEAKLRDLQLAENTLVMFLGDNGTGRAIRSQFEGREFAGGKGLTTDAGMHVPLIVSWPGRVAGGRVCPDLVDTTDILPTLCAAAGLPLPAGRVLDGRSFWPQLEGKPGTPRDCLYAWYSPRQNQDLTVREFAFTREHKLYRTGEFYDLKKDPEEKNPLPLTSLPAPAAAVAAKLRQTLSQYDGVRPKELDRDGAGALAEKAAKKKKGG